MTSSIFVQKTFDEATEYIKDGHHRHNRLHVLKHIKQELGEVKFDLITADGCVDHDVVISKTEECNLDLIRCQINTILTFQKDSGDCVLKMFDLSSIVPGL